MQTIVRYFRVLATVALLGLAFVAIAPYANNYVSSQAVVNAPLNTVLSPIRGVITQPSAAPGTGVAGGTPLVAITLEEPDRRYLSQLRARHALLRETLAAIEGETAQLDAMRAEMAARIATYRERLTDRLEAEEAEIRAEIGAAEAALANAEAVLRRSTALAARGHASATRSDADVAARDEASGRVARLSARLASIGVARMAAEAGISVQEGWSDVPYSQQRLDEILLRGAALEAEHRRVAAEQAALEIQIAAEEELELRRETFRPEASADGVIWKPSGGAGESVVPGDVVVQMVDCAARFVEVTLPERHFGGIAPGDLALVRLKGGGELVEARVGAVLGAGAKFDHPRLAAAVYSAGPDELRVLVPLSGTRLGGDPGAFCHVGRSAEVRFPRSGTGLTGELTAPVRSILSLFGSLWSGSDGPPPTSPEVLARSAPEASR